MNYSINIDWYLSLSIDILDTSSREIESNENIELSMECAVTKRSETSPITNVSTATASTSASMTVASSSKADSTRFHCTTIRLTIPIAESRCMAVSERKIVVISKMVLIFVVMFQRVKMIPLSIFESKTETTSVAIFAASIQ